VDREFNYQDPIYDNWFDFVGHGEENEYRGVAPMNYSIDCEQSEKVAVALTELKRHEAATFIRYRAASLASFVDSDRLLGMFEWNETHLGYRFWEECFQELVEVAFEELPSDKDIKAVRRRAAKAKVKPKVKSNIGKNSRSRKNKAKKAA